MVVRVPFETERVQEGPAFANCLPLGEARQRDTARVGAKAVTLGRMMRAGVPVPPGFVVTSAAFEAFLERHGLRAKAERLLNATDYGDPAQLCERAIQIQQVLLLAPLPQEVREEIARAYENMGGGIVSLRPSLCGGDELTERQPIRRVEGASNVAEAVRARWAAAFDATSLARRRLAGLAPADIEPAVIVQRSVAAEVSGMVSTADPSGDGSSLAVKAIYGLGEPLFSGGLTPDVYRLSRNGIGLMEAKVAPQPWMLRPCGSRFVSAWERVPVPQEWAAAQKLNALQLGSLATLGLVLEKQFGAPQEVEFILADGLFYVLECRPIVPAASITRAA